MTHTISKILVANRGEIACRIIRGAQQKGFRAVAVYSEADRNALHVKLADEAVLIGPAAVTQSYLKIAKIIDAARRSGAQAIHPGYGFLSENAGFAQACADAGIIFIGPSAEVIRAMGDKALAKRRMIEADVPCVPGYQGDAQDDETFVTEANRIGFPIMVKAVAGGGGRGMRLVAAPEDLLTAVRAARSEAKNAFGSDALLLERAVIEPRHVEIQVFGDSHGNVIHLGERDCSIQRRHQKVVEESPSPAVGADLRARMGEAAVQAARSIGYVGAGTVEFLLDAEGKFYFLEMNTRLQVEHPVTELVTGLDLVSMQLDVALGKPLAISQEDVVQKGHAIEVRLYAEDPARDFLPQTGEILRWEPATGEGVRIDHGLNEVDRVSPFYDPMIAKIVAWGGDREEARRRLIMAVQDSSLFGTSTNKAFLAEILGHPDFAGGHATTAFIAKHYGPSWSGSPDNSLSLAIAAILLCATGGRAGLGAQWQQNTLVLATGAARTDIVVTRNAERWAVTAGEMTHELRVLSRNKRDLRIESDGVALAVRYLVDGSSVHLDLGGHVIVVTDETYAVPEASGSGGDGIIRAPMNGLVTTINVAAGADVKRGQPVLVLEAMKMEHRILASIDGTVKTISIAPGSQVAARDILLQIEGAAA